MNAFSFLFCLFFLVGCTTGRSHTLDTRWLPLTHIIEASDKLMHPNLTTTVSPHCYVPDLKDWLADHPYGSVEYEAILRHEQVHAQRQEKLGLALWIGRYLIDPRFRWNEEQEGYRVMLLCLKRSGRLIDINQLAKNLNKGYTLFGIEMVSEAEAKDWLSDLLKR